MDFSLFPESEACPLAAVHRLLIAVSSLVADKALALGTWTWLARGMWMQPVSPALAGRFLSTAPPGKSLT